MNSASEKSEFVTQHIGPYVLETEIGEGAHGKVYRAYHREEPENHVALKIVENRGSLDRLMVEPEILSKLQHPGIVGLQDYFIDHERLVVALEFLDGQDLKAYSEKHGKFSISEVFDFLRQMASALLHAHAAGILHRDIKPANILVIQSEQKPRYVLTDFGISRISDGLQVSRHSGGTYHFMAPEQLRGRPTVQSDLWALGVVAYQMLTGELPFDGESVKELTAEVMYKTPTPLPDIPGIVSDDELASIIYGLLEKQPADRFDSAKTLLERLGGETADAKIFEVDKHHTLTVDEQTQKKIRRYTIGCVLAGLLWSGPLFLIPTMVVVAGLLCFYQGQQNLYYRKYQSGIVLTLLGLLVLCLGYLAKEAFLPGILAAMISGGIDIKSGGLSQILFLGIGSMIIFNLIFVPLSMYLFGKRRSLQRERELRRAITEHSGDTGKQLEILGKLAQERSADLVVRQKYAESLLTHGRSNEAVVEAKLMLEEDPYNVAAGLLLAHSYFELGLYELTTKVCDSFLAAASYCFEFRELRDQANLMAGEST